MVASETLQARTELSLDVHSPYDKPLHKSFGVGSAKEFRELGAPDSGGSLWPTVRPRAARFPGTSALVCTTSGQRGNTLESLRLVP